MCFISIFNGIWYINETIIIIKFARTHFLMVAGFHALKWYLNQRMSERPGVPAVEVRVFLCKGCDESPGRNCTHPPPQARFLSCTASHNPEWRMGALGVLTPLMNRPSKLERGNPTGWTRKTVCRRWCLQHRGPNAIPVQDRCSHLLVGSATPAGSDRRLTSLNDLQFELNALWRENTVYLMKIC